VPAPVESSESVDHAARKPARDDGVSWIEPDLDLVGAAFQQLKTGQKLRAQRQRYFFGAARLFFSSFMPRRVTSRR
jgi:hypothetical protein